MKQLLPAALALLVFANSAHTSETPDYVPEDRSVFETFTSKILKVYSFTEGDVHYAAYVVTWKNHEVVVPSLTGLPGEKIHAVGDSLRCRVYQWNRPSTAENTTHVMFSIASERPSVASSLDPLDPAEEQRRLQAIVAEVDRRRSIRKAAMKASPPPGDGDQASAQPKP